MLKRPRLEYSCTLGILPSWRAAAAQSSNRTDSGWLKPGPVAWADQRFKGRRGQPIGWRQGFGIIFDDLVAALCTLLVIALWRRW